ncbi:hypothetical protein BDF21DRAFT_376285 [Thamnidium elegans]|nr:hypothetical protein BDF21DRAFT_376285 [Thamnidium elegans]
MSLFSKLSKNNDKTLYPWSQKKLGGSNSALPRAGHAATAVSPDAFIIYGGTHRTSTKKELFYIDANNLSANSVNTSGDIPSPRISPVIVAMNGHVLLFGGKPLAHDENYDPGFYLLNLHSKQWTRIQMEGVQPTERSGHSAVAHEGVMYIWGGQNEGNYFNDLFIFNSSTFSTTPRWEQLGYNNECPEARSGHISQFFENKLFIFGGTDGQRLFDDIWSFDLHTGLWTRIEAEGFNPAARESCASAMVDDVIYIIGGKGENGVELNDLCAYKIRHRRWFRFQNMGPSPSPRHGLTMTAVRDKLYVLGGDNETARLDDSSFIFILDSTKIKYPADIPPPQQVPQQQQQVPQQQQQVPQHQQQQQQQQQYQQQMQGGQVPQQQYQQNIQQKPFPDQRQQQQQQQQPRPSQSTSIPQRTGSSKSGNSLQKEIDTSVNYIENNPPARPPRHMSTVPEAALRRPRATSPLPQPESDIAADIRHHNAATTAAAVSAATAAATTAATAAASEERQSLLREIKERDVIISEMKKKENWWRTEVSLARKQRTSKCESFDDGPDADEALLMDIDHLEDDKVKLFEQLVSVKSELRRVRASILQQAQPMSEKVAQADRMRTAALQEAAYFKSKYLALKSYRQDDLKHIEVSRCDDLEKRLAAALIENESNSKMLQQLQKRSQHDQTARVATEERAKEAQERAEEAQQAHQRALEELQVVYNRATKAELQVRDNAVKIADLTHQLSEALMEQPIIKSQEVTEAQLKASQLEAANLKARNDIASLKQKLAESMDDIARLRTILNEREDALSEAKIHVEDCEIQLGMMREALNQQHQKTSVNGFAPTRAY